MIKFLYIYGTGYRTDGFNFAVGEKPEDGAANGSLALFQRAEDAHIFAYAMQSVHSCMVHVLPSADIE